MCEHRKSFFERLFDIAIAADPDMTFAPVPADQVTVMNMDDIELPSMIYYVDLTYNTDTTKETKE